MADTRINALSTATVSETTDYLPIDGGTGTRKLSAFSPSFGGSATVGGTLTVNGTGTSTFAGGVTIRRDQAAVTGLIVDNRNGGGSADLFLSEDGGSSNYFRIYRSGSTTGTPNVVNISNIVGGSASTTAIEFGSPVKALSTTASTGTSSGALVVGNGSSGGLGVGGAGYFGGVLNISSTAGLYAQWKKTDNASGSQSWSWIGDNNGTIYLQAANDNFVGANNYISFTRSGVTPGTTTIHGTTDSTGTSSGALVVSGGLGVAKSINAGANGSTHIFTGGDGGSGSTIFALKDNAGTTRVNVEGVGTVGIGVNLVLSGSSNVFRITNAQTPSSASATGTAGTICWDSSYIYVCTATNTWKRAALSTW